MRKLIGAGSSAEVWALDEKRALKLFYPNIDAAIAEREFAAAKFACASGLLVAKPLICTCFDNRPGIEFERIRGSSLLKRISNIPPLMWIYVYRMAKYHLNIHDVIADMSFPTVHAIAHQRIIHSKAGMSECGLALRLLSSLPQGDRLGHGDFHPGNVLISAGELVTVDWSKAWIGSPAADVARTELLIRFGSDKPGSGGIISVVARKISAWWYRKCYERSSRLGRSEIDQWRFILAVAWFRGQPHLKKAGLLTAINRWHLKLAEKFFETDLGE